ncbi:hypothetical protein [Collinsella ihumii]|uniref:hypothetical protein n=1 Tax=Collinsella ihumii TaxID=1720204 RepID=UPI0025AA5FC8|nr:hypothetical protein [Collinsella ihumii]MDN0055304.1 hypothetical protein [Collinsella ihumii]
MAVATASRARAPRMAMGLPCGRRVPKGRVRWYPLKVREGSEASTCSRLMRLLPRDVLMDCFPLEKERWFKHAGVWELQRAAAYRGYAFAVTADPAGLYKALAQTGLKAEIAGADDRAWMPLAPDAQEWFERCMDGERVLRSSTAVIVDGVLHVQEGPLVGQEPRIRKVDRHRRRCEVSLGWDGAFTEQMPLDVPFKS